MLLLSSMHVFFNVQGNVCIYILLWLLTGLSALPGDISPWRLGPAPGHPIPRMPEDPTTPFDTDMTSPIFDSPPPASADGGAAAAAADVVTPITPPELLRKAQDGTDYLGNQLLQLRELQQPTTPITPPFTCRLSVREQRLLRLLADALSDLQPGADTEGAKKAAARAITEGGATMEQSMAVVETEWAKAAERLRQRVEEQRAGRWQPRPASSAPQPPPPAHAPAAWPPPHPAPPQEQPPPQAPENPENPPEEERRTERIPNNKKIKKTKK